MRFINLLWGTPKVPYFFYFPDKFVFAHFWGISIEWMKKLFFFSGLCFFFPASKIEWMNDMWTCPRKKKNTKKHAKYATKKNNPLLLKKRGLHQNRNEWPMNFSAERKKHILFFFFGFGKKKTRFSDLNEWMANELIRVKKIRYLWLGI